MEFGAILKPPIERGLFQWLCVKPDQPPKTMDLMVIYDKDLSITILNFLN